MADIGNEIDAIRAAKIGEQVREDIAVALEKMNEQAAAAQEWATGEDDPTAEPSETNNAAYWAAQAAESVISGPSSAAASVTAIGNAEFEPGSTLLVTGGINSSGAVVTDASRIRSQFLANKFTYFKASFAAKIQFFWYSSAASSGFVSASEIVSIPENGTVAIPQNENGFIRLALKKQDGSNFTTEQISAANTNCRIYNNDAAAITDKKAYESARLLYNKALLSTTPNGKYEIVKGSKASSSGVASDSKLARTRINSVAPSATYRFTCPDGFVPYIAYYSSADSASSSTYISIERPRIAKSDYMFTSPPTANGVIITFYATDKRDITDEDVATISNAYMIYGTSEENEIISASSVHSKSAFVAYMNQMCSKLGMEDSSFVDSSGLSRSNETSPEDELKLAIVVAGNSKALDIWSTKDASFDVGGSNARTISVTNNVYGSEPAGAAYKLLGGKGGSLESSQLGTYRKARVALYEVAGVPVAVSLMGPDEWIYNNMPACAQDLCAMMDAKIRDLSVAWTSSGNVNFREEPSTESEVLGSLGIGTLLIVYGESDGWTHCRVGMQDGYVSSQYVTTTMGGNIAHLLSDGGGYAAVKVPVCVGAYQNAYTSAEILGRDDALSGNADETQTPASTTKTLTMLCTLNIASDLKETIELASSDISIGSGSTFYAGDKLILEDALRIMMMESSNTLATAIGRWIGRKLLANQYLRDGTYSYTSET